MMNLCFNYFDLYITCNIDLRRIFVDSPKLVSLKLSFPTVEVMSTLFEFGLNLKAFELNRLEGVTLGDFVFWKNLVDQVT